MPTDRQWDNYMWGQAGAKTGDMWTDMGYDHAGWNRRRGGGGGGGGGGASAGGQFIAALFLLFIGFAAVAWAVEGVKFAWAWLNSLSAWQIAGLLLAAVAAAAVLYGLYRGARWLIGFSNNQWARLHVWTKARVPGWLYHFVIGPFYRVVSVIIVLAGAAAMGAAGTATAIAFIP